MNNREYLASCVKTKSYQEDFVKFIIAVQIDACARSKNHYTEVAGNIFPTSASEWGKWLSEEATDTISNVTKIMNKLEEKGINICQQQN